MQAASTQHSFNRTPSLVRLHNGEIAVRVPDELTVPTAPVTRRVPRGPPRVPAPSAPTASAEELDGFEKHVWHGCFICVIYLPRNMERCTETIANVVQHGFPPPYMIPGVTPRGNDSVHDCVCRAHHTAVGWFLSKGLDARYHLLVLEDDARFVFDDAPQRLRLALDSLESWGKWGSLHVGHIPMGPIYPLPNGLVRSVNPCTSHCYVLNRRTVRSIFALVPERLWKRPMMVEGHWAYPADERFAMTPPLATQCVMPKEMATIPIVRALFTFQDGEVCSMYFGYLQTLLLVLALGWLLLLSVKWPLAMLRRAELDADGDDAPPCRLVRAELSIGLDGFVVASALLLHACYYAARRFTCALAERRHWRTYGLDAARTGTGLAVAGALEFGYVTRVTPLSAALSPGADGADELSRAAAVLLVAPLLVWPCALALHGVLTDLASRHRRLQAVSVSGRYVDPLSLTPREADSAAAGADASDSDGLLARAFAAVVDLPPALLRMGSRRAESSRLLSRSENSSSISLIVLEALAAPSAQPAQPASARAQPGASGLPRAPSGLGLAARSSLAEAADPSATSEPDGADGADGGAGGDARDALRALELAVAAADAPERLQAQTPRADWWLAQTTLWVLCVAVADCGVLAVCWLMGTSGPIELTAAAIARLLPWSCTRKEVALCAVGRLVLLTLVASLVDAQLRCAHFQHSAGSAAEAEHTAERLARAQSTGELESKAMRGGAAQDGTQQDGTGSSSSASSLKGSGQLEQRHARADMV